MTPKVLPAGHGLRSLPPHFSSKRLGVSARQESVKRHLRFWSRLEARRVHHIRPRRAPLVRMAGRVLLAAVRLGFGDAPPNDCPILQSAAQPRTDKCLCACHRVNSIIVCRQSAHRLRHLSFLSWTGLTGLTGLRVLESAFSNTFISVPFL